MPQTITTPPAADPAPPASPLSVDEAVQAVLKRRSAESRSFGNEDDVEGPRPFGLPPAAPAP